MTWALRIAAPRDLVQPVPVDPCGLNGPTPGQARGPHWRRASHGLYVPARADRRVPEQRILEESGRLPSDGAVTGWAALRLYGGGYFDGLDRDGTTELPVRLVVPAGRNLRAAAGIDVHRERLPASDVRHPLGIPATAPERASFDEARRARGLREAVVVLDMALASGVVTLESLERDLQARSRWQGIPQVAAALRLADSRSMSPQETRLRLIWILDAGLPRPRCNWPLADAEGRFVGRPDLLCEELAVIGEYDGAEHRSRSRHRDDVRRDDAFRALGLEPFRVVGADLNSTGLVVKRMRDAITRAAANPHPRTWRRQANPDGVARAPVSHQRRPAGPD